ncbi:MAG: CinA family protein, partial [Alphaproteobacteria bacterium]|nr:CinA family protein [Alphaproteobacteria bacterium]
TVAAMANGLLKTTEADITIAISGIAGPSGGSPEKPVGTVWFGLAMRKGDGDIQVTSWRLVFQGNRQAVRLATVEAALSGMESLLKEQM